jgi:hypothetical protein
MRRLAPVMKTLTAFPVHRGLCLPDGAVLLAGPAVLGAIGGSAIGGVLGVVAAVVIALAVAAALHWRGRKSGRAC